MLSVTKGSPAEAAGLQAGDVILQIDGVRVEDDAHLVNLVSMIEVGKRVPLLIFRDGKTVTVSVDVGDRGRLTAAVGIARRLATIRPSYECARRAGASEGSRGAPQELHQDQPQHDDQIDPQHQQGDGDGACGLDARHELNLLGVGTRRAVAVTPHTPCAVGTAHGVAAYYTDARATSPFIMSL